MIKCVRCGAEFQTCPSAKAKYCSRACSAAAQSRPKQTKPVSLPGGVPGKRIGRPPSRHWPERECRNCGKSYRGRNAKFCCEACRLSYTKEALPEIAGLVKPLLGTMSYRQVAETIAARTGRPCHLSQVGRAVAKLRAAEVVQATRLADEALAAARLAVAMEIERARVDKLRGQALRASPKPAVFAPIPRRAWTTQTGVCVTVAATSAPEVTDDEVRLGRAVLAGAERGLVLAPEKPKRKRKAPRLKLVPATARREV